MSSPRRYLVMLVVFDQQGTKRVSSVRVYALTQWNQAIHGYT